MDLRDELRLRSGPEIIDAGIQLARRHYWPMLLAAIPFLLPKIAFALLYGSGRAQSDIVLVVLEAGIPGPLADAAAAAVALAALQWNPGGAAETRGDAFRTDRLVSAALRVLGRRFWAAMASGLVRTACIFYGFLLFVAPGLYALGALALVPLVVVAEPGLGVMDALRRSSVLTAGHRWRVLGCYGLPYAAILLAGQLMVDGLEGLLGAPGYGPLQVTAMLAGAVLATTLTPVIAAIQVMLYLDLRVRKEALDLEADIAAPAQPAS